MEPSKNLFSRLLILSVIIFITNSWSIHHLGNSLKNIFITNAPLTIIAIISFFSQILSKQETKKIMEKVRNWFFFFLKTPVLILFFGLILTIGSCLSSITVLSSGIMDKTKVRLALEGPSQNSKSIKQLNGPNDMVRFIKFTNLFGKAYYLEVEGYGRYSFDLYPWLGKNVRITEDLIISPSILIRIPTGIQMFLPQGLIKIIENDSIIAEVNTNNKQGSILVGHDLAIPTSFIEKWKRELTAEKTQESPAALSLLRWHQPVKVKPKTELIPGKTIEIKFIIKNGKMKAHTKYKINSEEIQDIILSIIIEE